MKYYITICFLIFSVVAIRAESRPNIIVVLCDDLGYGDLELYGHPIIKTPHLNQMAAEGDQFTSFYSTAPVCSASRVGLLTGRSPNRAGVYDWIPPARKEQVNLRDRVHMRESEVTIAQLLKKVGYATCLSGKWHCNSKFASPEQPQPDKAGFDYWFATHNNASPSHKNPTNFYRNGNQVGALEGYSCQLVVDEGLNWIDGHVEKNKEQPFFMYVAFHEPHEPVASPEEFVKLYRDQAETEEQAEYYANVHNIDSAVGKLLAGLKKKGLDENTLVIFTSDNGPETLNRYKSAKRSYGTTGPLKGMKLWTSEGGFRVAGVMRWPKGLAAGQNISEPVSALDFFPTFCQLAGATPPEKLALDGSIFLPALKGQKIEREKPLLWVFYNSLNEPVAMLKDSWKITAKFNHGKLKRETNLYKGNIDLIKNAQLTDFALYNLAKDKSEKHDLSKVNPEKLNEMIKLLKLEVKKLLKDSHVW